MIEPQLAKDADLKKLPYPVWGMPKIDGVRAMHTHGQHTGRSLDPFVGFGVTEFFSKPEFIGFDGEMTLGANPCAHGLCGDTTGALARIYEEDKKTLVSKMADFHWWLFDLIVPVTMDLTYAERYCVLKDELVTRGLADHPRLHIVPWTVILNEQGAAAFIDKCMDEGYEGAIFRNPWAKAKGGRPTTKGQELMRVKPWQSAEILVEGVVEGETNTNEKTTNTLGRSERSSAKAGKVKNGTIGTLYGPLVTDVYHPFNGKLLFPKGKVVTVPPGKMKAPQRKAWFEDQTQIVGHLATFDFMAHGIIDEPRMAGFVSKRLPQDMS